MSDLVLVLGQSVDLVQYITRITTMASAKTEVAGNQSFLNIPIFWLWRLLNDLDGIILQIYLIWFDDVFFPSRGLLFLRIGTFMPNFERIAEMFDVLSKHEEVYLSLVSVLVIPHIVCLKLLKDF